MIRMPHLETNVTIACQNRCVACNHFVPMQTHAFKSSMLEPGEMERDLAIFSRLAHADGYAMIGGEPTMHPGLVDLIRVARRSGVTDRIEVWTNGQELDHLTSEFWCSFDQLVVSRYPGKISDEQMTWITKMCQETGRALRVIDERTVPNFSRLLEPFPTDAAATRRKYERCFFKGFSRVLDRGWFYRCCTTPFIPKLLLGLPEGADGLRVDESLTEEGLHEFLARSEPAQSCVVCAGREGRGTPIGWREVKDPSDWVEASAGA